MNCRFCGGLGFYPVKKNTNVVILTCDPCKLRNQRKRQKQERQSKRKIYESADAFLDHEEKLQFESDYPTSSDVLKARGFVK